MPTLQELKETIEGFSTDQIAEFNTFCDSKIHNADQGRLSVIEQEEAEDCANDVDALSENDLDTLNASLADGRKLSQRPC